MSRTCTLLAAVLTLCALPATRVHAHPVPKDAHDRTIAVRLTHDEKAGVIRVRVAYRLEVDELTVILTDMVPFSDRIDLRQYRNKPAEFYSEFTRLYAPILAGNLVATVDGKPLDFTCTSREHRLKDEEGRALGHLRCDFVFEASFPITADKERRFKFRECNYETQNGAIDVALASEGKVQLRDRVMADEALKKRSAALLSPSDEDRLRSVSATVALGGEASPAPPARQSSRADGEHSASLLELFRDSDAAVWTLLLLAAAFGAVHALTPGHGKTLVAAYLVGERGTVWHALALGLVTTLTHTSGVILLALLLVVCFPREGMSAGDMISVERWLAIVTGLAVACVGFWLLLRRLAGQADHFHLPGTGHHHHHHDHPDHSHADHDHAPDGSIIPRNVQKEPVGWWGLVVLGMTGGIVPCWDAVALLVLAVGMDLLSLAVPLLLAFSAGLAAVLVVIGILVVRVKSFADSRFGESRFVRALPIISALSIIVLGLWLGCSRLPSSGGT